MQEGTLPTLSMGLGQPGHHGHSAAATVAGAFGTGSEFATIQSPSMGACLAWAPPWSTRNATFCLAQWMACGLAGPRGQNARRHVAVDIT